MSVQECRQSALQYLKIFFLASFERGSLTDKPAQVCHTHADPVTVCSASRKLCAATTSIRLPQLALQRLPTLRQLSGSNHFMQVSVAGSQTPQEKLDIWLRQKYEAFCKSLLELLHLDVMSSLQVAYRFPLSLVTANCLTSTDHILCLLRVARLLCFACDCVLPHFPAGCHGTGEGPTSRSVQPCLIQQGLHSLVAATSSKPRCHTAPHEQVRPICRCQVMPVR